MSSPKVKVKKIMFEVIDGDKAIQISEKRLSKMITWKYLARNLVERSDGKYYFIFTGHYNKIKLYRKGSGASKEKIRTTVDKTAFISNLIEVKDLQVCSQCFQVHNKKDLIELNKNAKFCSDCIEELDKCKCCNKPLLIQDTKKPRKSKDIYCLQCIEKLFIYCNNCGIFHDSEKSFSYMERNYCESCHHELFRPCIICGEHFHVDILRYHRGNNYCPNCYQNGVSIKDYNYVPDEFKISKLDWDNELCFGIEMEIETNKNRDEDEIWATKVMEYLRSLNLGELFYIKHDGTVQGFELVSHPMSAQFLHKNVPWYKMMEWMKKQGFTSYKGGNCGLHVHLNKAFFNPLDVHKLRLFFAINKPFIYKFSKRFGYNDKYCQFEYLDVNSFIKSARKQDGKYQAIRTKPQKKNTVEIRVFRGTLSYPRFLASLQFCDALAHYVKMVSIVSCQKKSSWINFIQWCTKTNNYNHFIKYIQNQKELEKPEI